MSIKPLWNNEKKIQVKTVFATLFVLTYFVFGYFTFLWFKTHPIESGRLFTVKANTDTQIIVEK